MTYKYKVDFTSDFKREYKKIKRQGIDIKKLVSVVENVILSLIGC